MPTADELRQLLIRNFQDVPLERFERAPLYDTRSAKLAPGTAARQLGIGVDVLEPGKIGCPYHFHHVEEEMFIVLQGEGTLRVAGEHLPVRAGDVVFIPAGPEYPHQLINTSAAPMQYLSISTQAAVEVCEYPDSGKVGSYAPGVRLQQRRAAGLDYWDGEP